MGEIEPLSSEISRSLYDKRKSSPSVSKRELFDGYNPGAPPAYPFNDNTDTESPLSSTEQMIRESQRLCFESEQAAMNTLGQMGRQREQIERGSKYVNKTLSVTNQAKMIMQEMSQKALRNK